MRIIAVDPGGTTGYCSWSDEDEGEPEFSAGQEASRNGFIDMVQRRAMWTDVIVCEDFRITMQTAKKSAQPDALKIIGALDYLAWKYGAKFVLQTPADAKRFGTDVRLRKAGFWTPGRRHANDAARHLFLHLCKTGLLNAAEVDQRDDG